MHRVEPKASKCMMDRARQLRRAGTLPERILWNVLRRHLLGGYKFRRQQPIGPYVADFYCEAARLAVELDGRSHEAREARDAIRDAFMKGQGIEVLRIHNKDLLQHREAIAETILRVADARAGRPVPSGEMSGRFVARPRTRSARREQ
jgi:ATP-dependent DNA helicase RecQ